MYLFKLWLYWRKYNSAVQIVPTDVEERNMHIDIWPIFLPISVCVGTKYFRNSYLAIRKAPNLFLYVYIWLCFRCMDFIILILLQKIYKYIL